MNRDTGTALALAAVGVGAWLLFRPRPSYSFTGKTVLITGGSRGLGLVMARRLVREGARVAICARDEGELQRAADELVELGGPLPLAFPCDVTDPAQVRGLVQAVRVHAGPIDVLINNAGVITVGPVSTMTRQDYEEALAVTFWGAYHTTEAVVPEMRERGQGRIVNISSIGGQVSVPHLVPYSVAKYALAGYSRGLRAELANNGITVTTVFPGLMRTGSPRNAQFKGQHQAEYVWFSVSDSLPLFSISAERAARSIIEACRKGDAEVVLSLPAQAAVAVQALFPELMAGALSLANRMLPRPGGIGTQKLPGHQSESALSPSVLTTLNERAAERNNEIAPTEQTTA